MTTMTERIVIDGAAGEGGGQVLRSALALSLVTGRPFTIDRIRATRQKPGLLRQHLTAVQAAAKVGSARVNGADLGSQRLEFEPAGISGGELHLTIGTAGSATLVLQTLLPALLRAREGSRLTIEGGTHNPNAPSFDFIERSFLPVLRRMGASVDARLHAHGFYPAGGGRISVAIEPCERLTPVAMLERGTVNVHARAFVAQLPEKIGRRELNVVRERLALDRAACRVESIDTSISPGNVLMVVVESEMVTEVIMGFGIKGVTAEKVASGVCDEAERYLASTAPVGPHLADQLLIPMALAGGGTFRTPTPTSHTLTNAGVVQRFLDVPIAIEEETATVSRISVG